MTSTRWPPVVRTWLGPLALAGAVASAGWLFGLWLPFHLAEPVDLAYVQSLREQARTDADVQQLLQPETDRQTQMLVLRRTVYPRLGLALAISIGVLLAWVRWLRPDQGAAVAVPAALRPWIERRPPPPPRPPPSRFRPPGDAAHPGSLLGAYLDQRPPAAAGSVELRAVDEIVRVEGTGPDAAIPILQAIQSHYRYLPVEALGRVVETTAITPSQLEGVATFYDQFRHRPVGRHIVRVCEGTACHVSGAVDVANEMRRCLGITHGSDTDASGLFTIERVACVGSCSLAPVVTIDDQIRGHVAPLSAGHVLREFLDAARSVRPPTGGRERRAEAAGRTASAAAAPPVEIRVGVGSCGIASGALEVQAALEAAVAALGGRAVVKPVGCAGLCHSEPLVEIVRNGDRVLYGNVAPADARRIVRAHVSPGGLARRVREGLVVARDRLFDDAAWTPMAERAVDATPYTAKQVRVVLENCGAIDPLSLDDYRARGGMRALAACLTGLSPDEVVDRVRASGLRGRGGAGFPTADKWDVARRTTSARKYVICNGDEGDPGAFMDRAVLEGDPFRVIEGLVLAAYAIGASEGFVYVRREYPIAVRHVRAAIREATARGLLGANILESGFDFTVEVREGAGAFVCGEETALIQSIEGQRGMPTLRPPFPAQVGLWGQPTVINNVETLACLPWILRHGPEAFAALGTERSKGTKVFALAGKVRRGGLIEVPMGITIREIVEEVGGGIKDGRAFKAVLLGGPSGGCIPARLADTRIDYDELTSTGAIMGSGGLVVLDDRDCVVEIARYFLDFTQHESCGKCTFCRIGTKRMLEILERITAGLGRPGDLATLEELATRVTQGSLCGLGRTAPNPVLTTLRYFREEYEAHIAERRCPAAQCKALVHYEVLDTCTGCTLCAQACPVEAIEARPYERHLVIDDRCTRCGMCLSACPEHAIRVA